MIHCAADECHIGVTAILQEGLEFGIHLVKGLTHHGLLFFLFPLFKKIFTMTIKLFRDRTLPRAYREQIRSNWDVYCRGTIDYDDNEWAAKSLADAEYVLVALAPRRHRVMEVQGFMLLYTHKTRVDWDGKVKPVCRRYEWYINVLCVNPRWRGVGHQLVAYAEKKARRAGKSHLRLYSLPTSKTWWKRQGFRECDKACVCRKNKRKEYRNDRGIWRMTKCIME